MFFKRSASEAKLKGEGRPPTGLKSKNQGQHVTSFALIKKGFTRPFPIIEDDQKSLRSGRDRVYEFITAISTVATSKLSDYVSLSVDDGNIAETKVKTDKLVEDVGNQLKRYNENRVRKHLLRYNEEVLDVEAKFHEDIFQTKAKEILVGSSPNKVTDLIEVLLPLIPASEEDLPNILRTKLEQRLAGGELEFEEFKKIAEDHELSYKRMLQNNILQQRRDNELKIITLWEKLSELGVAYYNRLQCVAFNPSSRAKKRPNTRMSELAALNHLDKRSGKSEFIDKEVKHFYSELKENREKIKKLEEQLSTSRTGRNQQAKITQLRQRNKELQSNINIHQQKKLISCIHGLFDYPEVKLSSSDIAVSFSEDRTNDTDLLVKLLARHLFIFFSVYPEAAQEYECDLTEGLNDNIIRRVISPLILNILREDWPTMKIVERTTTIKQTIFAFKNLLEANSKNQKVQDVIRSRASSDESTDDDSTELNNGASISMTPSTSI